jgi:hypothetical protein
MWRILTRMSFAKLSFVCNENIFAWDFLLNLKSMETFVPTAL